MSAPLNYCGASIALFISVILTAIEVKDFSYLMRIRNSMYDDFYSRLSSRGDANGTNIEKTLKKTLAYLYVANVGNVNLIRIFREDSLAKRYPFASYSERRA